MNQELEILAWMLVAGILIAVMPLVWSRMQARRPGRRHRPLRIRETDPNDAYTC
jgi:hypothetical protein